MRVLGGDGSEAAREVEIMVMPGDDEAELVKPATLWQLVGRWMTPAHADIERAVIYTFHSVIAQGWRRGRLLLAGDAAHQTPPFLGQGMCAAIRDASNLAWKLDAVLRGRAQDTLLDSYASERAPHVHAFIDLAVKLGDIIQTTDPQAARERDAQRPDLVQFHRPGQVEADDGLASAHAGAADRCIVDRAARIVWMNERYARRYGLDEASQAIGQEVEKVIPTSLLRQVETDAMPIGLALPPGVPAPRMITTDTVRSASASRSHLNSVVKWTPKSAAISSTLTPGSRFLATRTTSSRNSLG